MLLVQGLNSDEPIWRKSTTIADELLNLMQQAAFLAADKLAFLSKYHFPMDWLRWDFYPDDLYIAQKSSCESDPDPTPAEHVRYGAFLWWVRKPAVLTPSMLRQLCLLATVDPDPGMAGAAIHDIICHPSATEDLAEFVSNQIDLRSDRDFWGNSEKRAAQFFDTLTKARHKRFLNSIELQIVGDLDKFTLSEQDLREFYLLDERRVMLTLAQHPNLPVDLLEELAEIKEGLLARQIRIRALEQLKKRKDRS